MAKMSSVARVNKALNDFKAGATPARRAAVKHAYRNTKGLPRLDAKFHIKGSRKTGKAFHKYSGEDIHRAVNDAHWEAERLNTASKRQKDASTLKSFKNLPHREAKFGTKKPLDHVKPHHGPLSEFHLPNKHPNAVDQLGPARIIVENAGAHHVFRGVISHDQSRAEREKAYDDHFKVHKSLQPQHVGGKKPQSHLEIRR